MPSNPAPIDWSKPIQTRDGRPARFLARLDRECCPCIYVVGEGNDQLVMSAYDNGRCYANEENACDVVNAPERWVFSSTRGWLKESEERF